MNSELLMFNMACKPGIGYQEYRNLRKFREGISSSQLEHENYKRFIIYFGRMHLTDYRSESIAIGPLKVGKTYYPTSIMRARNEAGAEFRFYAEIVLPDAESMNFVEKEAHRILSKSSIVGAQGQQELFNVDDSDLEQRVQEIAKDVMTPKSFGSQKIEILEILTFYNNQYKTLSVPIVDFVSMQKSISNGLFV